MLLKIHNYWPGLITVGRLTVSHLEPVLEGGWRKCLSGDSLASTAPCFPSPSSSSCHTCFMCFSPLEYFHHGDEHMKNIHEEILSSQSSLNEEKTICKSQVSLLPSFRFINFPYIIICWPRSLKITAYRHTLRHDENLSIPWPMKIQS